MEVVAEFRIPYLQWLTPDGQARPDMPRLGRDQARLQALYRGMCLARVFDAKAVALQRTGRLGTYASSLGQEAVAVGLAAAMQEADVLLPTYRETGALLWRGVRPEELLCYWGGDERGMDYAGPRQDFPICIPIATQMTHAAGVATAFQLRGEPRVAVVTCGDGGSSKGDFYEALNLAGVWSLPLVCVLANNQWAISVPRDRQSAAATLAQKAVAAGIPGVQVDGNDVIAVHQAVADALDLARRGHGPTLIEALTYRLSDHTTADDATRYRPAADAAAHLAGEPVARLRSYLLSIDAWDEGRELGLQATLAAEVETAVERYLAQPGQRPSAMFQHLHATLPEALRGQQAELESRNDDD